jgi:hypothetical protein
LIDHNVFCSRQYQEELEEIRGRRTYHRFAARERRVTPCTEDLLVMTKPGSVWSDRRLGQQAVFIDLSAYLVAQLPHIAPVWLCLSVASVERYW